LAEGSINRVEVKVPHFLEEFGVKLFPIRYVLRPRKVDQVFGHEFRESTHKVVEADFVRSRHLDNTFDRLCERGIADRTGDVIRRDGLGSSRSQARTYITSASLPLAEAIKRVPSIVPGIKTDIPIDALVSTCEI
jgi:hypothetical protein